MNGGGQGRIESPTRGFSVAPAFVSYCCVIPLQRVHPWDRICDPLSVRELLYEAGVDQVDVVAEPGAHIVPSPEAWWTAVLGSGYRGTLEQLDDKAREYVRKANLTYIRDSGIRSVQTNVVYAIATKG